MSPARFVAGWSWLALFVAGCTTYPDPPPTDVPDATEEPNEPEDADDGATIVDEDVGSQTETGLDANANQRDAGADQRDAGDARAANDARDADGPADQNAGDGGAGDASEDGDAGVPSDGGDAGGDAEDGSAGEDADPGEPARCDDGVTNGSETGLDCGGPSQSPVGVMLSAASLGSKIFLLGGATLPGVLEAFDTATKTWSRHAQLSDRFTGPAVTGPDGRIYAIGGVVGNALSNLETDRVSAYQPSADRWAPVPNLTTPRVYHAVVQGADGRIYALGGSSISGHPIASVEVYGPLVSITPSTALAGTNVVVTGNNFAANAGVRVYLGTTQGSLLATGRTSGGGAIAPPIVFSSPAQSSEGFVTIVDDKSRFPIKLPFAVN